MATVYSATHRNGNEFAVKVLHPELSLRADIRNRFLREGHAASAVKHVGAVQVLDDDVAEDGSAFLVMELLRGDTLETLWERRGQRLPMKLVVGIGLQLLDVLAAAHANGVVHRDHQACERLSGPRRTDQGPRLRHCPDSRSREQQGDAIGNDARNARVHGTRTGHGQDEATLTRRPTYGP